MRRLHRRETAQIDRQSDRQTDRQRCRAEGSEGREERGLEEHVMIRHLRFSRRSPNRMPEPGGSEDDADRRKMQTLRRGGRRASRPLSTGDTVGMRASPGGSKDRRCACMGTLEPHAGEARFYFPLSQLHAAARMAALCDGTGKRGIAEGRVPIAGPLLRRAPALIVPSAPMPVPVPVPVPALHRQSHSQVTMAAWQHATSMDCPRSGLIAMDHVLRQATLSAVR